MQALLNALSMQDLLYSFGIANPGALTLHNYPRLLQEFERPDGKFMDLAATDILRSRELGVPRYNEFRKVLHLAPAKSFEELTDNPIWAKEIRQVYDDIDHVDLTVDLFAEPKPEGFGFSDTTFRIFILIASRRLNSDRFFTTDYTPEDYAQAVPFLRCRAAPIHHQGRRPPAPRSLSALPALASRGAGQQARRARGVAAPAGRRRRFLPVVLLTSCDRSRDRRLGPYADGGIGRSVDFAQSSQALRQLKSSPAGIYQASAKERRDTA